MSYHDAEATKFLATHCAACGRELVDSTSVEQGMGPQCRKNYYNDAPEVTDAVKARLETVIDGLDDKDVRQRIVEAVEEGKSRKAGNILVHYVAHHQTTKDSFPAIRILKALRFEKLAERIEDRLGPDVEIEVDGDQIVINSPYNKGYVEDIKKVQGRRFHSETKAWSIPRSRGNKVRLWSIIKTHYEGCLAVGPKGPFTIGQ